MVRTVEEFHRLLEPGGRVFFVTPHYTDFSSFCDPTHKWHLNSFSSATSAKTTAGLDIILRHASVSFDIRPVIAFWRYLGFEFLVNASRRFRRFWEFYLCYLITGEAVNGNWKP